jgi:hypothetical protein
MIRLPPKGAWKHSHPSGAKKVRLERAMIGKWAFRITALWLAVSLGATAISRAEMPWSGLLSGMSVEADPSKDYVLKEANGPWIIMACCFSGTNAKADAHDLALELRKRYRMEAFVYDKKFVLDDPNGNLQPMFRSPHTHVYSKFTEDRNAYRDGAIKEVAVVVGNFTAVDDPDAHKALAKLKAADPDCLRNPENRGDRSLAEIRAYQDKFISSGWVPKTIESRRETGPLAHAFITCNPLLPEDYFAPKGGLDELVVKINENVEYSLLKCPGKYTVQVAHFTGEVIINQNDISAIESGRKAGPESTKQGLAAAAEKAHDLTVALREKGYDAYEFHDINASLVTVGSFNSVGTPRPDGKIEINPAMDRVIEFFRAGSVPGAPGAISPKCLIGIYFDAQPIPVEVPRRSIGSRLSQRLETAGE